MPKLSLEKLIDSLTQGELRAFSLSIKGNNNPNYYKLFNEIRSGKPSNKGRKSNNETQLRKYLYTNILESIIKGSKTIDSQIGKGLKHAEVLYNRQLMSEAWKEIERIEKIATLHERFGYIIQILEWKKIIGIRLKSFSTEDYKETSKREKETIKQYLNYLEAADIYNELQFQKRKQGYIQEVDKLPELAALTNISSNKRVPKRTLYYYRMAEALHSCLIQDIQGQYEITKLIVRDAKVINDTNECMQAYFEHLTSCICIGKFDELLITLTKLKSDIKKGKFGNNLDIKIKLFYYSANYELMTFAYMGSKPNLLLKMKEVEMGVTKLKDSLSVEMTMLIGSAMKVANYFLGDVKKAKNFVSEILEISIHKVRYDIYQDVLFFKLIVCTDENDVREMERTLETIKSTCDLNKPQYRFEKEMFDIFSEFVVDIIDKPKLYTALISSYKNNTPTLKNGFSYTENYYPYYLWSYANQQGKPILELAEQLYLEKFKF